MTARSGGSRRLADFAALAKPRIVAMVLVTTLAGYYLGAGASVDWIALVATLFGTGLAAAGSMALNQYLERDVDAQMARTRSRPLPDGRLDAVDALGFGTALLVLGLLHLAIAVNELCALVTAATAASYLALYTPLKRRSSLCTLVGAVPGALPPVAGWAAARGDLSTESWILFAILFLWQLPHSLAIAWLYREDYARAGLKLLPVVEPDGGSTARQIVANCSALLVVGLLPTLAGVAGRVYFAVAFCLGAALFAAGARAAVCRSPRAARQLLLATLAYLPLLLGTMAIDKAAV